MVEIIKCKKCNAEFTIDPHQVGANYQYCLQHRKPKSKLREVKNKNCLFCGAKLKFGVKGRSKPFCNWSCELRYIILQNQSRQKIGCELKNCGQHVKVNQ
jgi:hypothetical protein